MKMWTIYHALQLRREHPEWFGTEAAYAPLLAEGAKQDHVLAFMRAEAVVTVVPRFSLRLLGAWRDTSITLPDGRWTNRLTGEVVRGGHIAVKALLKEFPAALLVKEPTDA